jgi:hypothetical protein
VQVRWLIPFLMVLLLAAACAPGAAGETAVPTFTLIPVTPSETPTDIPPTSTPADLPAPQDVLDATETPTRAVPTSAAPGSDDPLLAQDPVAAELVGIAQRFVADDLDLPTSRVRLVSVFSVAWTDSALNCPLPNSEAVEQETDGYRIVLQAGDQEFLFHTDFDRVVPCDPDNEQLPAGVILPTEEATVEATDEATVEATVEATSEATESS